jgi:hypothetical protein
VLMLELIAGGNVDSASELARLLGVSHQRVSQLLQAMQLDWPTRQTAGTRLCRKCGVIFQRPDKKQPYAHSTLCPDCRRPNAGLRLIVCPRCGRERRYVAATAKILKSALCRHCWTRLTASESPHYGLKPKGHSVEIPPDVPVLRLRRT